MYIPGYIACTFGDLGTRALYADLLKGDMALHGIFPILSFPGLPGPYSGSYSVIQYSFPMSGHQVARMVNDLPILVIDYAVNIPRGLVVPQRLWRPQYQGSYQRCVVQALLELPIFFIHEDGTVGEIFIDMAKEGATMRSMSKRRRIRSSAGAAPAAPPTKN